MPQVASARRLPSSQGVETTPVITMTAKGSETLIANNHLSIGLFHHANRFRDARLCRTSPYYDARLQ